MAQTSGGSRLQKLLKLIDGGATLDTRRAAASQIFRIVASHPSQLSYVLREVATHLRHKDWDARVAAAYCLGLMADHFIHHTPDDLARAAHIDNTTTAMKPEQDDENAVKLEHGEEAGTSKLLGFDIERVLRQGTRLVASGGEEYEAAQSESLDQQRANLKKRMGLGGPMDAFVDTNDFFADEDLTAASKPTAKSGNAAAKATVGAADLLTDMSGMSARERAAAAMRAKAAKRQRSTVGGVASDVIPPNKKVKGGGGGGGSTSSNIAGTSQPEDTQPQLDAEALQEQWQAVLQGRWIFQDLCDQLCIDVVHPVWEVRHGAALGLREIMRSQAAAAGVVAPVSGDDPGGWSVAEGHGKLALGPVSSTDVDAARVANAAWLEDCALHLLCTLALDRFNDFVSDQVVSPVRETTAQALGVLSRSLAESTVIQLVEGLRTLSQCGEWQARHGGLLGLKYVVAARDVVEEGVVNALLPAAISGLQDKDDDVRAVAAEALLPAAEVLALGASPDAQLTLTLLWDALLTLEDLSPATASVVTLIARVYSSRNMPSDDSQNLSLLVPRLWPFLRHNLTAVRLAVVKCIAAILAARQPEDILLQNDFQRAGRLLFQNLLIESDTNVVEASANAWNLLITRSSVHQLSSAFSKEVVSAFFQLASTPAETRLDKKLMEKTPAIAGDRSSNAGLHTTPQGASILGGPSGDGDGATRAAKARLVAATALGLLGFRLASTNSTNFVLEYTLNGMNQASTASGRVLAAYTAVRWIQASSSSSSSEATTVAIQQLSAASLEALNTAKDTSIAELTPLTTLVRSQAQALMHRAASTGLALSLPPTISSTDNLIAEGALHLANQVPAQATAEVLAACEALKTSASNLQNADAALRTAITSSYAAVVVHSGELPPKLTLLIQPLIAAVRRELLQPQQDEAACALARLSLEVANRTPSPAEKIVKNVCGFAVGDPVVVPNADSPPLLDGDETATSNTGGGGGGSTAAASKKKGSAAASVLGEAGDVGLVLDDPIAQVKALARRGAEKTLGELTKRAGPQFPASIPPLWTQITEPLVSIRDPATNQSSPITQAAVHALRILQVISPVVALSTLPNILAATLSDISLCLGHANYAVKLAAARTLSALAATDPVTVMPAALRALHPLLCDGSTDDQRLGSLIAVREIVTQLGLKLIPYVQLVVVPLLRCMSAADERSRRLAAQGFAAVVALMPLAQGVPPPAGLDAEQLEMLEKEGGFLQQLLDNRKADDYYLPFELKGATLRRYQQEGINWLAFLRRFGLHGVLADDMGLGKTLQATSIIAATLHDQRQKFAASGLETDRPLPSLIVCPSTLVAHWPHEISKFVSPTTLKALQYSGTPSDRTRLRPLLSSHDVLVISYESLRADIDWISSIRWSYCVLDEGHAIRNPTSKIAQAAKKVIARHRLLLSGTPVQNSTAELWALFDFLMPGFLGSSRDFTSRYGKAVGASRGAAKGSAEAQAGILALDALHRQVMPFILRRTKDQVLKDLPPKIIQDIVCEPGDLQRILYEDFQASQALSQITGLASSSSTGGNQPAPPHIFQALHYLRRLCSHPILVLDPKVPAHAQALAKVLGPKAADNWEGARKQIHNHVAHSPKLQALQELLLDCGIGHDTAEEASLPGIAEDDDGMVASGHRALIFAQTKTMLDLVESVVLNKLGVTSLRLDGDVEASERFARVQKFNADPSVDVMLLTTAVGGLGLNLTTADTVIFMEHDWNPQKDLQAMDRAHRLGQRKTVNVYRLLVRGTLEEEIMSLQRFKLDVASAVVNADNVSMSAMDTGKLLDLFTGGSEGGKEKDGGKEGEGGMQAMMKGLEEVVNAAEGQYAEEFDLEAFKQKVLGKGQD